jgi:hypothetical protein
MSGCGRCLSTVRQPTCPHSNRPLRKPPPRVATKPCRARHATGENCTMDCRRDIITDGHEIHHNPRRGRQPHDAESVGLSQSVMPSRTCRISHGSALFSRSRQMALPATLTDPTRAVSLRRSFPPRWIFPLMRLHGIPDLKALSWVDGKY